MNKDNLDRKVVGIVTTWIFFAMCFIWMLVFLSSCTISLQNFTTNAKAQDLIKDDLDASADVQPELKIPAL